jgi:phage/plasmid primase-like uncharacterized protein
MFSRRRGSDRSFGSTKDYDVTSRSNRGRICNGSDDSKCAKVAAIAALYSGNLLEVATALRECYKDKVIVIAGDVDHRLESNPGRAKALEAAAAVKGVAIFPEPSAEQRDGDMTDFNDLGRTQPEVRLCRDS